MKLAGWLCVLLLQFLLVRVSRAACPPPDKRALLDLAALFNSNGGYYYFDDWGEGDCCAWKGVTCGTASNATAVTKLSLPFLRGKQHQLMTPICNLTSLRRLDLSDGPLLGPLLPCIANLRHLRYLDLSGNLLDSIPPSSLAQLPHLHTLILYENAFADTISLISGALPSSLRILDLCSNRIQGSIPGSFFDLHPSLQQLYLDDNYLSGTLPESMYNLTQLQAITLPYNSLTGRISPSIHKLQALQFLYLSSNNLDPAPFPPFLGNLSELVVLFLSDNSFNSSIPPEWHNLTLLTGLHLSGNALSSAPSLPSWIFRLPLNTLHLSSLQLPSTSFTCDLFRYLNSTIADLDLSLNNLNSTALLHDCLTRFSFPSLQFLNLSHNLLHSSPIPSNSMLLTPDLQLLHLGSCGLKGSIPDSFIPDSVNDLTLSDNHLTGELPAGIRNSSSIGDMDLSNNYLTSSKQLNISGKFTLLLSNNDFKGDLEYFLLGVNSFEVLDVSFNYFTGIIPPYLGNHSESLERLKLGNNHLKGVIPADLGSHNARLRTVSLHGNQLVGNIPSTLFNCSSLQVLDLGHNALRGELEDVFFSSTSYNLNALRVLLLGYNQLGGPIPASLGMTSPNLQLLDLSNNHFIGSIPPHLNLPGFVTAATDGGQSPTRTTAQGTLFEDDIIINTKGLGLKYGYILNVLTSLDLSGNSLSGLIPPALGELTGLMFLNLSRNRFTGSIPMELSKLGALESLDLSFNNLTGSIPTELKGISSLEVFNVSFNDELQGGIPAGAQLTDPNSYLGDNNLCGRPLQACPSVSINSTQAAHYPQHQKKSAAQQWASIPGIIIGLSVGSIFTLCILHIKVNDISMFERLFKLLKGYYIM